MFRRIQLQSRRTTPAKEAHFPLYFRSKFERDGLGRVGSTKRKYRSIRDMEYPKFQTGIFGRMESAYDWRAVNKYMHVIGSQ